MIDILNQNCPSSPDLANQRAMVATNIDDGMLLVIRVHAHFWEAGILSQVIPRREDSSHHVVEAGLCHGAISDGLRQVVTPISSIPHHEIHASISSCNARHLSIPVGYHEALEVQLSLQDAVQQLGILTAVRVVDALILEEEKHNR